MSLSEDRSKVPLPLKAQWAELRGRVTVTSDPGLVEAGAEGGNYHSWTPDTE